MFVTFLENRRVSEGAFTVKPCVAGVTYEFMDSTACFVLNKGWAREATEAEIENHLAAKASESEVLTSFFNAITARPVITNPATKPEQFFDGEDRRGA